MKKNLNQIIAESVHQVLREYTSSSDDGAITYQGTGDSKRAKTIARKAWGHGNTSKPKSKAQQDHDADRIYSLRASDRGESFSRKFGGQNSKADKLSKIALEIKDLLTSDVEWEDSESEILENIIEEIKDLEAKCINNGNIKRGYRVPEEDVDNVDSSTDINAY